VLLFKITFTVLYAQSCASQNRITKQYCLPDIGVSEKEVHKHL